MKKIFITPCITPSKSFKFKTDNKTPNSLNTSISMHSDNNILLSIRHISSSTHNTPTTPKLIKNIKETLTPYNTPFITKSALKIKDSISNESTIFDNTLKSPNVQSNMNHSLLQKKFSSTKSVKFRMKPLQMSIKNQNNIKETLSKKSKHQEKVSKLSANRSVASTKFLANQWNISLQHNQLETAKYLPVHSMKKKNWKCTSPDCCKVFSKVISYHFEDGGKCNICGNCSKDSNFKTSNKKTKNTPEEKNINPELAMVWNDNSHRYSENFMFWISPKLDGVRCVVRNLNESNSNPKPVFTSRNGRVLECCDHLVPFFSHIFKIDPTAVIDGELYTHTLNNDFESLLGSIRCRRENRNNLQYANQLSLQFHCFTLMHGNNVTHSTSFEQRYHSLLSLIETAKKKSDQKFINSIKYHFNKPFIFENSSLVAIKQLVQHNNPISMLEYYVNIVPQIISTFKDVDKLHNYFVKNGYEGIMVRDPNVTYMFGRRTPYLLKVKPFEDDEFEIVDCIEGEGTWKGTLGNFICKTKDNTEFGVTPSVTMETRKYYWLNRRSFIGFMITVEYQELSKRGIPRFPVGKSIRGSSNQSLWI